MRTISKITYDSEKDRQTTNVYLIPTVGDGDCFFHAADHSNQVDENDAIEYDFISPYPSQVKADQYITDAQVNQLKCSISEEIFNVPVILNFMVDDNGEEVASSEIYEREVIIKVIADMFFALKENVNLLEDQHGYLKWQGKPTQIRKQQLSKLVKEDYNLILLNDLIDIEPEQACSDTIYLSLSGRYYIRDGGGILQQGRIADMLITRLPPIELTDLKFKAEIIKDIIYQGHTMLIVSHSSKKREVLECLQQPGMQDAKIYLPQSWQNDLCWLICNKTDWHEENRRADIIKCLQQDKRLLSIKLTYIVPDDAIAINNTIQCSAFYLASKFGSFNIVLDLLTELSQNDCIDIIIQEKSTAMYQLGTNLPHLDRALKESLGALNGSIKQLDLLLQLGANILQTDQAGNTLLHYMTSVDNIQALWLLKTAGQLKSILNNDGNTALHLAILANNEQLIDLLLKHKVDVTIANKEGGTPLHLAVTHSNPSLVKRLCKLGARKNIHDKNNAQHTPIFIASTTQREDILQILVGDEFLMPLQLVLHLAIEVDDSILLSWWLENGGNLEVRNNNKQTPLCLAVVKENLVAIQILLSKGADLSAIVDERLKQNVFHVAAKNNKILKLLLKELVTRETELQFMINNRDINGDTPLHLAAAVGNEESIVLLINAGASPGQPNNDFLVPSKRFNNHDKNSLDVLILFSQVGEKLSNPISYDTLIRKKISNPQSQCLKICTPLATNRVLICTDIMQIFDTAEKKTLLYLPKHSELPNCILSLRNGYIVGVSDKNEIHIWSLTAERCIRSMQLIDTIVIDSYSQITYLQELEDNRIISITKNGFLNILERITWENLYTLQTTLCNISCAVLYAQLNKNFLICGTESRELYTWDLDNPDTCTSVKYDAEICCLKIVNDLLVIGCSNGAIKVTTLVGGVVVTEVKEHTTAIYCITETAGDGTTSLISASIDGVMKNWCLDRTQQEILQCTKTLQTVGSRLLDHRDCTQNVLVTTLLPNGDYTIKSMNFYDLQPQNTTNKDMTSGCCMM